MANHFPITEHQPNHASKTARRITEISIHLSAYCAKRRCLINLHYLRSSDSSDNCISATFRKKVSNTISSNLFREIRYA